MKNYYAILKINRDAEKQDIKNAYRDIVKKCHPDSGCACEDDGDRFVEATEAYETLTDASKRKAYDRDLRSREMEARTRRAFGRGRRRGFPWPQSPIEDITGSADFRQYRNEHFLELTISSQAAARGGRYALGLSFQIPCPDCSDADFIMQFFCPACGGRGFLRVSGRVDISIPSHVRDGQILSQPVNILNRYQILLRVIVRIRVYRNR